MKSARHRRTQQDTGERSQQDKQIKTQETKPTRHTGQGTVNNTQENKVSKTQTKTQENKDSLIHKPRHSGTSQQETQDTAREHKKQGERTNITQRRIKPT